MRAYEFEIKARECMSLGGWGAPILYKKIGECYTPAILSLNIREEDTEKNTPGMAAMTITAIPELLYWGGGNGKVIREKIPFSIQKQLGIPKTIWMPVTENPPETKDQKKNYYIAAEKTCCALEAGCLTPAIRTQYLQYVQPIPVEGLLEIYRYFFPEACEQLFI